LDIWIASRAAKVLYNSRTVTPNRSSFHGSCGVVLVSAAPIVGTVLGVLKSVSIKRRRQRRGKKVVRVENIAVNDQRNETKRNRPPFVPRKEEMLKEPIRPS
jgi:primosomal protein N'